MMLFNPISNKALNKAKTKKIYIITYLVTDLHVQEKLIADVTGTHSDPGGHTVLEIGDVVERSAEL